MPRPARPDAKEMLARISELKEQGMNTPEACHEAGIHYNQYLYYKKKERRAKQKLLASDDGPRDLETHEELLDHVKNLSSPKKPICIIIGDSGELASVLTKLGGL